jgi:hypothetical protein
MSQKRRFLIYSIMFLAIGLFIVIILPMSLLSGMILGLCILLSIIFLKLKGGEKWQINAK